MHELASHRPHNDQCRDGSVKVFRLPESECPLYGKLGGDADCLELAATRQFESAADLEVSDPELTSRSTKAAIPARQPPAALARMDRL